MPLAGDFEIRSSFVKILPFGKSVDATRDFPKAMRLPCSP